MKPGSQGGSITASRDRPSHAASPDAFIGSSPCHDWPVAVAMTIQKGDGYMTSCLRRFGITFAFFGFASILPSAVGAQPPVYLTQWGSYGSGNGQFNYPVGVATDAAGNVYVTDNSNNRIQKFTNTGTYLIQWGSYGSGDGQFNGPFGVATDVAGNVYVTDFSNHRIQKFGPAPTSIAMAFDFTPNTLNLTSQGLWVTGFLEPPSPFAASDIDIASIR